MGRFSGRVGRRVDDDFEVELALGGFLAGYSGNTRLACQQDLRQYAVWCHRQQIPLFDVRLTHSSCSPGGSSIEAAQATIFRRLSTVAGFYRYCAEEQLPTSNPAVNVRRPRSRGETTTACWTATNSAPS